MKTVRPLFVSLRAKRGNLVLFNWGPSSIFEMLNVKTRPLIIGVLR